jgi:hypothetical protein
MVVGLFIVGQTSFWQELEGFPATECQHWLSGMSSYLHIG